MAFNQALYCLPGKRRLTSRLRLCTALGQQLPGLQLPLQIQLQAVEYLLLALDRLLQLEQLAAHEREVLHLFQVVGAHFGKVAVNVVQVDVVGGRLVVRCVGRYVDITWKQRCIIESIAVKILDYVIVFIIELVIVLFSKLDSILVIVFVTVK
jgi:hypothetical protein